MENNTSKSIRSITLQISDVAKRPITLIAVSKKVSTDQMQEAIKAGITHFGESYVQEFLQKYEQISEPVHWHFIGQLQRNKVKYIIDKVHLIHSVDRESLANEINKQAEQINKIQNVLIQVKLFPEKTKGGIDSESLNELFLKMKLFKNLDIKGFMLIPPFDEDIIQTRNYFKQMKQLADKYFVNQEPVISMGMSHDYIEAIEEGSTMVRIGTALFGDRL